MGSWNDILKEVNETQSQYDYVRRKYLKELSDYTGRNTVAYYSSWLNKQGNNLDINDADMTGFMTCVHGLDCTEGLDLVLHTPGGSPAAAEAIVSYLRAKFDNDIRVIVPQLAMSAGTMIACSAKEIIMGKQSSLGPIDPQFNGIPAYNIMMEFEEAKKDLLDILVTSVENNDMMVLISSHHLSELEKICDDVTLIRDGRIYVQDELEEVTAKMAKYQLVFPEGAPGELYHRKDVCHISNVGSVYTVVLPGTDEIFEEEMRKQGAVVVEQMPMGLEESFIYMNRQNDADYITGGDN